MLLGVMTLILSGVFYLIHSGKAQTDTVSLTGYAWSENIGWISFGGNVALRARACSPESTLTQTLNCDSPWSGTYTQTKTSTCASETASSTYSDWVTTSDNCECVSDSPLTQTLSCPSGQTGSIVQNKITTCVPGASAPTYNWVTSSNSCECVPDSPLIQTSQCPPGQQGIITQTKTSTCAPGATTPTYSDDWVITNTCIIPCASETCTRWSQCYAGGYNVCQAEIALPSGCTPKGVKNGDCWYGGSIRY